MDSEKKPMVDVFGSNSFCIPTADELLTKGYSLRCVTIRLPEEHRSRKTPSSPLAEFAKSHDLPLAELRKKHELTDLYEHWPAPDAIVVASFGILIPFSLLSLPRFGVLNIHPSLLPKYRGPSPIQTTLLNGDATTGVSIIVLDDKMDHGPILLQQSYPVLPQDTTGALRQRLGAEGAPLLCTALRERIAGRLTPTAQDETLATLTKKIAKEDGRVEWSNTAVVIERRSRAFDPWPGLWTQWNGVILKLFDCTIVDSHSAQEPGTVLSVTDGVLHIQAGDGTVVGFGSIQREGKKRMTIEAFIAGNRNIVDAVLE